MPPTDFTACRLCPRACGVNREAGERGVCGETAVCRLASAAPHHGEEPPFTGTRGSGTLFFTGCSCRCFFCQNHQISLDGMGAPVDPDTLYDHARRLVDAGVHNLNLVTPDHVWPHVEALGARLRAEGCDVPLLFNGSGYHTVDLVRRAAGLVDIFLPDMKFADPELAREVMGDANYPDIAMAAIEAMIEARGFLDPWDPSGERPARRGVLVRHLVLPGAVDNSLAVLARLRDAFGKHLPLSVMSQFHPTSRCLASGRLTRRLHPGEYDEVRDHLAALGFVNVYLQQPPDPQAPFLPDFSRRVPFAAHASDYERSSELR